MHPSLRLHHALRHVGLALACAAVPLAQDPAPRPSGGADPSDDAFRMGSPPELPPGTTEEEVWPAATAEGWSKPCLVVWQRTFDDAVRVARAQNRPILVAVNMDGEIASEHFAGVRYREPETAEMMSRYVCVIASVYRHTPRDYDEAGRRVECPRFGTVTCGEHVEAERELYERYFDGVRVSPRHIVIDLEGRETYDVYYSWDTETVITTFKKGVEGWPEPEPPIERSLEDLARSADVADRQAVERAYLEGDRETRRALLVRLAEEHVVDQVEVLRAAIFGLDLELARLARRALAECETEAALDLIAEALKAPLEASERELLLAAVDRMGRTSARARTLAALHGGLAVGSKLIAPRAPEDLAREYEANAGTAIDVGARARAAQATPEEPGARLELALALIARAEQEDPGFARLLAEDALANARAAERLGAAGPRLDAALALASDALGEREAARAHAVRAVEAGLLLSGGDAQAAMPTPRARVRLLELFGDARRRAIRDAYRQDGSWPPEWLSDVNAAYASIAGDPLVDDAALVDYHDFLLWIGATPRADLVLEDALERFPDSALLHDRLRARLLWEGGPERLEQGYAERLERLLAQDGGQAAPTQITWFAGYASLVAAEHHRRRGELDQALASYARAEELYQRNVELFPGGRDVALHFVALGRAGRARVALERGELDVATRDLTSALALRPDSAATPDGLGLTPIQTARMLKSRLEREGDAGRAAEVQRALDALDPRLSAPPPSELPPAGRGARAGG